MRQLLSDLLNNIITKTNDLQTEDLFTPLQRFSFAPAADGTPNSLIPHREGNNLLLTKPALQQLCSRSEIPFNYVESLPPKLKDLCINQGIQSRLSSHDLMIRTLKNATPKGIVARAILTDKYQPFDDSELFSILARHIPDEACNVVSAKTDPFGISHVKLTWTIKEAAKEMRMGDIVKAGISIRNSETGKSSVDVRGMTYRLSCLNGAVTSRVSSKTALRHIGNADRLDGAIKNAIACAVEDSMLLIENYKKALDIKILETSIKDILQPLTDKKTITKKEQEVISADFLLGNHKDTLYDVSQAITHVAQTKSDDRRYELEVLGADVVTRPNAYVH